MIVEILEVESQRLIRMEFERNSNPDDYDRIVQTHHYSHQMLADQIDNYRIYCENRILNNSKKSQGMNPRALNELIANRPQHMHDPLLEFEMRIRDYIKNTRK